MCKDARDEIEKQREMREMRCEVRFEEVRFEEVRGEIWRGEDSDESNTN